MRRVFFMLLLFSILLTGCVSWRDSSLPGPPSGQQLCAILGYNWENEKSCQDYQFVLLIKERFPLEVTKRDDVTKILGPFLVTSVEMITGNGVTDTYILRDGLIEPLLAHFNFDNDNILESIIFSD